jgi:hypothetical protein
LSLRSGLELLAIISLNCLELSLHLRQLAGDLLELRVELHASGLNIIRGLGSSVLSLRKSLDSHRNGFSRRSNDGFGSLGLGLLGRLASRLFSDNGSRSRGSHDRSGSRSRGRSRFSNLGRLGLLGRRLVVGHFMIYTKTLFLSGLTHYIL